MKSETEEENLLNFDELEPLKNGDITMNLFDLDRKIQLQLWQAVDKGMLSSKLAKEHYLKKKEDLRSDSVKKSLERYNELKIRENENDTCFYCRTRYNHS